MHIIWLSTIVPTWAVDLQAFTEHLWKIKEENASFQFYTNKEIAKYEFNDKKSCLKNHWTLTIYKHFSHLNRERSQCLARHRKD